MRPVRRADNLTTIMCRLSLSFGVYLLENSGPVQACNGIAFPLLCNSLLCILYSQRTDFRSRTKWRANRKFAKLNMYLFCHSCAVVNE
jgi:hypothetical protein